MGRTDRAATGVKILYPNLIFPDELVMQRPWFGWDLVPGARVLKHAVSFCKSSLELLTSDGSYPVLDTVLSCEQEDTTSWHKVMRLLSPPHPSLPPPTKEIIEYSLLACWLAAEILEQSTHLTSFHRVTVAEESVEF
jgi:hypothetical protein